MDRPGKPMETISFVRFSIGLPGGFTRNFSKKPILVRRNPLPQPQKRNGARVPPPKGWRVFPRRFDKTTLRLERLSSVDGMEYFTNLTSLDLWGCTQLSDVSPLAALTSLTSLDLSNCTQLSDVSPLAALTSLTSLYLGGSQLSDVSPLAALTSLTSLYLENCSQLSDVSPLAALVHLKTLILTKEDVGRLTIPSSIKEKVRVI